MIQLEELLTEKFDFSEGNLLWQKLMFFFNNYPFAEGGVAYKAFLDSGEGKCLDFSTILKFILFYI